VARQRARRDVRRTRSPARRSRTRCTSSARASSTPISRSSGRTECRGSCTRSTAARV
jgi:hypothetical protein